MNITFNYPLLQSFLNIRREMLRHELYRMYERHDLNHLKTLTRTVDASRTIKSNKNN